MVNEGMNVDQGTHSGFVLRSMGIRGDFKPGNDRSKFIFLITLATVRKKRPRQTEWVDD